VQAVGAVDLVPFRCAEDHERNNCHDAQELGEEGELGDLGEEGGNGREGAEGAVVGGEAEDGVEGVGCGEEGERVVDCGWVDGVAVLVLGLDLEGYWDSESVSKRPLEVAKLDRGVEV